MDTNIGAGKVKQKEGAAKQSEAELAEAARRLAEGKRDEVVGVVQEKYGLAKDKAQEVGQTLATKKGEVIEQVDDRLNEYNSKIDEAVDGLPGDLKQIMMRYPWMTFISALGIGVIIGVWLKSGR